MSVSEIENIIGSYAENQYDPAKEQPEAHKRQQVRDQIANEIADPESILGTTSDAASLALYGVAALIKTHADHGSAQVKASLNAYSDGKLVELANQFIDSLEADQVELTAMAKGLDKAVADILARQTGVAQILKVQ